MYMDEETEREMRLRDVPLTDELKKKNPELVIGICGCMMQQKGMADKILSTFPFVDIIFGTHNSHKFPEYLHRVQTEGVQIKEIFDKETEIIEGIPVDRESSVSPGKPTMISVVIEASGISLFILSTNFLYSSIV